MAAITAPAFYIGALAGLGVLAAVLVLSVERARQVRSPGPQGFRRFQVWFLLGWGICVAADWLQGPYLYVLYSAYGYDPDVIAHLFLVGFVVSGVAGTFVGHLADRFGRRLACEVYCVLYILACLTKHVRSYGVLLVGRILGGFATSLLFSVFESWVVSEMTQTHKVGKEELHHLLGRMYLTSYAAAIVTGLASQGLVELVQLQEVKEVPDVYWGGSCLPYDASIIALIIGAMIMRARWAENFGEMDAESSHCSAGCRRLPQDWMVWVVGLVAACFESAMYVFVFSFTPALKGAPMGVVFSLFMLASMCGASALGLLARWGIGPQHLLPAILLLGAVALGVAVALDFEFLPTLASCLVFEVTAGVYWPGMATLKGLVVAEDVRAHVYNLYRIPLNALVVAALAKGPPPRVCFSTAAVLLAVGALLAVLVAVALRKRRVREAATISLVEPEHG